MYLSKFYIISMIPFIAIIFRILPSESLSMMSYIIIALYSFLGTSEAIKALVIATFLSVTNDTIFPLFSEAYKHFPHYGHYLIIASVFMHCFYRILFKNEKIFIKPIVYTLILGFVLVIHSLLFSQAPDVSILKAVLWTLVMLSLIYLFDKLTFNEHKLLINQIMLWIVFTIFLCIPFIFTEAGYRRNNVDFQGLFNGPQVLGIVTALLFAFQFGSIISNRALLFKSTLIISVTLFVLFFTHSRTAIFSLVFSSMSLIICLIIFIKNPFRKRLKLFKNKLVLVLIAALIALLFNSSFVENIIKKRVVLENNSIITAYVESRSQLFNPVLNNISEKPLTGIGFGVTSKYWIEESQWLTREPFFGLPYKAAVEKGVFFLAVLEELGIIGSFIVLIWLMYVFRMALTNDSRHLAIFFTIMFINMGENIFFSSGSIGLLSMILLAWIMTSKKQKLKSLND
jgi:O-antigen ligase